MRKNYFLNFSVAMALIVVAALAPRQSAAFCGFYVAKADTKLFNQASKVVLVRDEDKTVLTMSNDFKGDMTEFAVVIPVPTLLEKEQIHIASSALIDHLDAYSAPRLVEYYDSNPCRMYRMMEMSAQSAGAPSAADQLAKNKMLGVKVEAEYTIGEYDIVILSAEQSGGLETWLKDNNYKIPNGAASVLESYIKQKMKFFVAKVNLKEQSKLGFNFLRPIQIAYESPKFMLPIRLGMINADGPQDLFVFALTKKGRVETTNYRTVKLPEGMDVPLYVKDDFARFYKDMFSTQVKKEQNKAVFLEYAWDMGWCDPCAADPLSTSELKELGVFWLDQPVSNEIMLKGRMIAPSPAANVYISRLHVRYDNENFPEDLTFQETSDRTNFQGRYVLRHPWTGSDSCEAAEKYRKGLPEKYSKEAKTLHELTGWDLKEISTKMNMNIKEITDNDSGDKWWKNIWN